MSIYDNIRFLENIKQGLKRTVSWDKYRCELTMQPKNDNLDHMIYSTFWDINRLFILFKNGNNDLTRLSFDKYHMKLVETKDLNVLIDNKPFFDQPLKSKQEVYERIVEMSRNDGYTTGNL